MTEETLKSLVHVKAWWLTQKIYNSRAKQLDYVSFALTHHEHATSAPDISLSWIAEQADYAVHMSVCIYMSDYSSVKTFS